MGRMKGPQMSKSRRGRPKGSPNKVTNLAKQAIQMAFDKLGGVDALVAWVKADKANAFAFYTKVYPKLLPRPAVEAPPVPEELAPVRGALIWKPPTPSPYRPLSASTAATAMVGVMTGDDPAQATDEAEWPP